MGLSCSLLGHKWADSEVRRDAERRGEELVATSREIATCSRCEATEVRSEHTEVMAVEPVTVEVTGGMEKEPLEGAVVHATLDVTIPVDPEPLSTGADGRVELELPRTDSTVTFRAEHDALPEAEATTEVERAVEEGVEIALTPETGAFEIEVRVGASRWPGADVEVTPQGGAAAVTESGAITTDEGGRREVVGLPVGRYELSTDPELPGVETDAAVESAVVEADSTTAVTLPVEASYSLSAEQRERRAELRERIDELTALDGDTAIPRHYGAVLDAVLDLVEEVESAPESAVERGLDPAATVDALLRATAEGQRVVADAMADPRNVKLFRRAGSLPAVEERPRDDVDLEDFLDRASEGAAEQRRALRDRLAATDAFLNERWSDVAESRPAREVHTRLQESIRARDGSDDLTTVARAYVSLRLLDAVETLFEVDALRRRLDPGGTDADHAGAGE